MLGTKWTSKVEDNQSLVAIIFKLLLERMQEGAYGGEFLKHRN